jgi:aryl-alcohol dehydrogenase-like predicted oxidoreductase
LIVEDPWFGGDGKPTHVTLHRAGEEPRDVSADPAFIYAAEADAVAASLAERQAPEMSWADTLGNLGVQDAWRAAIGQQYASEREDAAIPTATGRPLSRRADAPMTYGEVPGLDKQVSRLVMGVDNQEKLLGQWMKSRGNRDEVVVIGKGAHTPHCDPESLSRQLLESLERLQTDHVDLYLMHRDNEDIGVEEFVDVLDEHRRAGRITAYGGSNWSLERFDAANEYAERTGKQPFTLLSNHLSLARAYDVPWNGCRHVSDSESQAWLQQRQVALFPWSSQARGFFTGRAKPEDRSDEELVRCFYSDGNFDRLDRARELASARGVEPTAIALAWLLHQPYPVFPLIGPRQISETRTSLPGLGVTLSAEEVAYLTAADLD